MTTHLDFPVTTYLAIILVAGVAAGGLASLIRALPWSAELKKKKPLGCPLCMAGWSAFLTTASALNNFSPYPPEPVLHGFGGLVVVLELYLIAWFGAMGIGAWIAAQVQPSWEV